MIQSNKNRIALLVLFFLTWLLLILRYVGGDGGHDWPDSDGVLFSLIALHLMQGESFPFYLYGQNYMGTFPVWINFGLFKLFGISHLWVEIFYAFVYATSITIISAFVIKRIGVVAALVFASLFCLFPTELDNLKALDSGNHNFSIFTGLLASYLFCLFIESKLEKQSNLFFNSHLTLILIVLLAILTYWSSQLGFIYILAIVATTLMSCRNQLGFSLENLTTFNFINKPKIKLSPSINFIKKWFWFVLLLLFLVSFLVFEKALFNVILICRIYFIYLFSKIPEPMNYFWAVAPLIAGMFYLYKSQAKIASMLQGNEKTVPWNLLILTPPILIVLFSLPTRDHLYDFTSIRYFESLQWLSLILFPLVFSLLANKTLRNTLNVGLLLLAVYSWYSPDEENYERLRNLPATIDFIQQRIPDESRLVADEKAVIAFLKERQLFFGYADYWLAYRLTFLTHEQFIISPYKDSRYPAYDERIEKQGSGFYLYYIDELADGREHASNNGKSHEIKFGELILFY